MLNKEHFNKFFETMKIRQDIWHKKVIEKKPQPWTDKDDILRDYKFTNVYRELDRSSQWLINNVIKKHVSQDNTGDLDNLIFKIIVFRLFNNQAVFDRYGLELPNLIDYDSDAFYAELVRIRKNYGNPFHVAYMQNMSFAIDLLRNAVGVEYKKDYAYAHLLIPKIAEAVQLIFATIVTDPMDEELIPATIRAIETVPAFGSFMSHEIYIDFCLCNIWRVSVPDFEPFNEDAYTNVGPGAKQGMELIFGEASKALIEELRRSGNKILPEMGFKFFKRGSQFEIQEEQNITLHQIEMWLCEYQKYVKMQNKTGKQRSKYNPYKNKIPTLL